MMEFAARMRDLSGGKPVGLKLCIGQPHEAFALVKAMQKTGIFPDFIVVDGGEGGTGAAPLELSDRVGMPLIDGLVIMRNALVGAGVKDKVRLAASGKVYSGFGLAHNMAIGADWCNAARAFMFSIGCIQAQACHTNHCPVGVATQDPLRQRALVVPDKATRVANFHRNTMKALAEMTGAAGLIHPGNFLPHHLLVRVTDRDFKVGDEVFPYMPEGFLLREDDDRFGYLNRWQRARAEAFEPIDSGV